MTALIIFFGISSLATISLIAALALGARKQIPSLAEGQLSFHPECDREPETLLAA